MTLAKSNTTKEIGQWLKSKQGKTKITNATKSGKTKSEKFTNDSKIEIKLMHEPFTI